MYQAVVFRNGVYGMFALGAALGFAMASTGSAQNYGQRAAQARSQVATGQPRPPAYPSPYGAAGSRARGMSTAGQGVALGQAAAPGVTGLYPVRPRPVAASSSLAGVRQALTAFQMDTGRMPTPSEGLNALLRAPAGVRNWRGPYISVVSGRPPFTDPWGNPYQFIDTSKGGMSSYQIRSNGPDGLPNTSDDLSISG